MSTPARAFEIADGLDVENNAAYAVNFVDFGTDDAHNFTRVTHCNGYANAFSVADGEPIPPLSANEQLTFLATSSRWREVTTEAEARALATAGAVVYAALYEPGHGHIARVMPSPPSDLSTTYVSAAGARRFKYAPLPKSFGDKKPRFFTPKET
jgi:hypothetical protein